MIISFMILILLYMMINLNLEKKKTVKNLIYNA